MISSLFIWVWVNRSKPIRPVSSHITDVIERSLSGGRETEELIAVTLSLCLCRSSFIRLKGLKQATQAHLLLHIKPSLPYLHYRKCMHRCPLCGFGNRNMSNKVALLLRWSQEICFRRRRDNQRVKPSLKSLNSPLHFEMNRNSSVVLVVQCGRGGCVHGSNVMRIRWIRRIRWIKVNKGE